MMYGWGYGGHWIGMIFWWVILIGIVFLVIYGISGAFRGRVPNNNGFAHKQSPLEILKQRYAKGEINQEEYYRMKEDLKD